MNVSLAEHVERHLMGFSCFKRSVTPEFVIATPCGDVYFQIVSGSLSCDAYFATANSLNQLLTNADLKRRLGLQIPTKKFNLIERAEQMRDAIDDVIVHNMADHKHCNVIVGVVSGEIPACSSFLKFFVTSMSRV